MRGVRASRGILAAAGIAVILAAALIAALLFAGSAGAFTKFVDCQAKRTGPGSMTRPIGSLEQVEGLKLGAGDKLLLRRGHTCTGTLSVRGGGSHRKPSLLGAWGPGSKLPVVRAKGESGVVVTDMSHTVVSDLEITNPGDGTTKRRGIRAIASTGVVRDLTIRGLYIHDVGGNLDKDAGGSGGIQADVLPAAGAKGTVRFDKLHILGNRIEDVSRSGIWVAGTADPGRPRASEPWRAASTRVLISSNRIKGTAGDGIVPVGTDGALVERNVVSDGNRAGRPLADPQGMICNAGIWTFHANNTLIRFNDVFHMNLNGCDGTGYDIDYDQDGTIVEFNLSHDNEGGFTLLCTDNEPRRADVRFNLSINDGHTFQESPCKGAAGGADATLDGVRMYNNTFVAPTHNVFTPGLVSIPALFKPGDFQFRNNIVVSTQTQLMPLPCGDNCSHNLFSGLPASGTDAVTKPPRFEDAGGDGRGRIGIGRDYRLSPGSPALGAGIAIPGSGRKDYFGNRITRPPSIGFQQPG